MFLQANQRSPVQAHAKLFEPLAEVGPSLSWKVLRILNHFSKL